MQRVVLLDDRLQFAWQLGRKKIHLLVAKGNLRDVRFCCGRLFDQTEGRKSAVWKNPPWMTTEDVCGRCITFARKRLPSAVMTQPFTEAERWQLQKQATERMRNLLFDRYVDS